MASINSPALTGNVENLSGLLYDATYVGTNFLDAVYLRGRNGGRTLTFSQEFVLSNSTALNDPSQPRLTENQTRIADTPRSFTREQLSNVVQPFRATVGVSHIKQSNFNALDGVNLAGVQNNVPNELDFQINQNVRQMRLDLNHSIINGTYAFTHGDSDAEIATRGLIEGILTNRRTGTTPDKNTVNTALNASIAEGLRPELLEIWVNPAMISVLTDEWVQLPGASLPATRTEGGVSYTTILTDFGAMNIHHDRWIPDGIMLFTAMGELAIAEKPYAPTDVNMTENKFGALFMYPLGKRGAAEEWEIFGEMGLDYGFEALHMMIDFR